MAVVTPTPVVKVTLALVAMCLAFGLGLAPFTFRSLRSVNAISLVALLLATFRIYIAKFIAVVTCLVFIRSRSRKK
jgi:hypothetical protein